MWIWFEHGPKYKEKDWTKSDFRGVQIYEEEWTGWMNRVVLVEASERMANREREGKSGRRENG